MKKAAKTPTKSKKEKLQKGEYYDEKKGVYRYRKQKDGKRHEITATNLKELRKKEDSLNTVISEGGEPKVLNYNLDGLFTLFINSAQFKKSTKETYTKIYNSTIKPSFLNKKAVSAITKTDISTLFNQLADKGLTRSYISKVSSVLRSLFEIAIDYKITDRNPAKIKVKVGKTDKKEGTESEGEIEALTIEQQTELLQFIKTSNIYSVYYPLVLILLGTGLRIGELLGLRWHDIHPIIPVDLDKQNRYLTVNRQLQYIEKEIIITDKLKTDNSKREIPLTEEVQEAFNKLLNNRLNNHHIDFSKPDCNYIFLNSSNKHYKPNDIRDILSRIEKSYNKTEQAKTTPMIHLHPHLFRHTFATRLFELGIDLKKVQETMGHSDFKITMNLYVSLMGDRDKEEDKKILEGLKFSKSGV